MATSLLATDGYKFSMAEAGWPLRRETFYYTHRKGGLQVVPLDIAAFVRSLLPEPKPEDYEFLSHNE
jgi:nicotinate phosphoribosyltransferase